MSDNWTTDVIKKYREYYEQVFDAAEKALDALKPEPVETSLEERYETMIEYAAHLEDEVDALTDKLDEAHTALKLLLDGEVSKAFVVHETRADSLGSYVVDTWWEAEGVDRSPRLIVRQHKL